MNLIIDEELKTWIDPLSQEEYELLERNIIEEGCRDPIVVWGGYLLDGHNRYEICQKHGLEFKTYEKTGLKTKSDVKIWMIENQLGKRNTTDFVRTALALKLKPLIEQRAAKRMIAGVADPSLKSDEGSTRTDSTIAKIAGVGKDTVRNVEKIITKATPDIIQKVRSGEMSISAAAKTTQETKPVKKIEPAQVEQEFEIDHEPDLHDLLDDAQKDNEKLLKELSELKKDNLADEVIRLNRLIDQLNGRLQGEITTSNEAKKQAKIQGDILAKIRKKLNVNTNQEILKALGA